MVFLEKETCRIGKVTETMTHFLVACDQTVQRHESNGLALLCWQKPVSLGQIANLCPVFPRALSPTRFGLAQLIDSKGSYESESK